MGAWYVLTRRGLARAVAVGIAALALLVFVMVVIASEGLIVLAVGLGLAAVSVGAASYALSPVAAASAIERAPRARHPVLLMNLKSGGGKAERFGLVNLCRQRGIEPIVLHPGRPPSAARRGGMTNPTRPEPVEERLVDHLSSSRAGTQPSRAARIVRQLDRLDRAAYRAVAEMSTPVLDRPLRRVSDFANFSKPWFLVAAALALFGGTRGAVPP